MTVKIKDLIVLSYGNNNCYPHVEDAEDALVHHEGDLSIDLRTARWRFRDQIETPIGEGRYTNQSRYGVIGVYTRSTRHLGRMVHDWGEAQREGSGALSAED